MRMLNSKPVWGLLFCLSVAGLAAGEGIDRGMAEVHSDRLQVDHAKRHARFEGNVRATHGDLRVRCDQMELTYNPKGEVVSLTANGNVVVTRSGTRAEAHRAKLAAKQGVLVLEGDPILVRGENRLAGQRITVHLKDNRIDITEARGTFKLGSGATP